MGPRSGIPAASKLRAGREWLRSRGPVTLAAALLLEVSSATSPSGTRALGLMRAALLVILLLGVLIAAAVDSLLTSAALGLVRGWLTAARWTRVSVFGIPAPLDLTGAALLDRAGRPLRGGARNSRITLLQRQHAQRTYARSLRGRLDVALAELRRTARPYSRRIVRAGLALESRVLAARAALIARSTSAAAWLRPRVARTLVLARARTAVLWRPVGARAIPRTISALRSLGAGLRRQSALLVPALRDATRAGAAVVALSRARLATIPVPAVPLPSMSPRTVRVVTVGLLMSFVFATVIGTTGLIASRGSVALGASTTLAIISGDVSVMDPGASEFRPGFDGDILGAGSTIKTGPETYAVLTYFEGSTVSIDPNTVLVIEALQANPDGSTVIGMRQDIGQTWHAVTKLLTAGSKYEVRTPTATATVRGTLFLVGVQLSGDLGLPETLIETTEGAVAAEREPTAEEPEGEEIVVPAGFQVRATEATPIPPPVPAPEPERKITVTVGTTNSVVVDPQGRSNGEVNGRIVVQTPGATVERVDGKIVVTLPNTTDGKISTVIQPAAPPDDEGEEAAPPPAPVQVTTVVQERGKSESRSEETVQQTTEATVTGVEIRKSTDESAPPELRKLDETEKKDAPKVKVAVAPAEEVRALVARRAEEPAAPVERSAPGQGQGGAAGQAAVPAPAEPSPKGIVNAIVTLTLPPLSADEVARREEQKRESDEREKRENEKRDARQREEDQKKIDELRRKEAQAVADAARIGGERLQEEGRRDVRRETEERRGEEERREETRQGNEPAAPVALFQQVVRAIAPADGNTRRDEDKRVDDLRKAEEDAQKAAEKVAEERRKAEQRLRDDSIKAEEAKRKDAEKRAEELHKAEDKAKEQAAKHAEETRKIEEKAREQAAKLADEQRKQAEKLLEDFRKAEEKAREQAAKQLEEQRKAEEKAREDAERRLSELRREEERARERERERERDRQREEDARRNRGGFVPHVELRPAPGIGSRSVEEEERSEQLREKQQNAAEREKRDS